MDKEMFHPPADNTLIAMPVSTALSTDGTNECSLTKGALNATASCCSQDGQQVGHI